jgi:redox-sensitive bicupin YhaK (pirin superfamily)
METVIHRADTRGHADHGWLKTWHTFSFADYHDPARVHFGALRVLNDDFVEGGRGFGRHPHDNMEIVTIMLKGELRHQDSMGHSEVLRTDEVQAMSAGTGIFHSEFNNLEQEELNLLQIWVFPQHHNTKPRYAQKAFDLESRKNQWQVLASPIPGDGGLELGQKAWFSRIDLTRGQEAAYSVNLEDNGVYFFVIEGKVSVGKELVLDKRDGAGAWGEKEYTITAESDTQLLAIEVPMG